MRRYIFLLFALFFAFANASAQQAVWNQRFQDYFDTYKDVAIEQMLKYHIPASITLAQGVLESGAGRNWASASEHTTTPTRVIRTTLYSLPAANAIAACSN